MEIEILTSVTLRKGTETNWVTVCITEHDLIELAKAKALLCYDEKYDTAECDEIDEVHAKP